MLGTAFTYVGTICTAVAADTHVCSTVVACGTTVAEIAFSTDAVCTNAALGADIIFFAVRALFITFGAYGGTFITAVTANTGYGTITAKTAAMAPTRISCASNTVSASSTNITGAVCTLLGTAGTYVRAVFTPVAAVAYYGTCSAGFAALAPVFVCTVLTYDTAHGAQGYCFTVGAGLVASLTKGGAI